MTSATQEFPVRTGLVDVWPVALGVVPFGLVTGAIANEVGLDAAQMAAMSGLVFAGASQLAALDLLADGQGALVVAATAWLVNLRFLLYGAALAPELAIVPLRPRLASTVLLIDQNFALAERRYRPDVEARSRVAYFVAVSLGLWTTWLTTTMLGFAVGASVPDDVPLEFGVPLMFLALLAGALGSRAHVVAAVTGGLGVVTATEAGAGRLSLLAGITAGIVAGWIVATVDERITGPA